MIQKQKPPTLQDLIDILALPNMGDEGRKAKLVAIKEWQIRFLDRIEYEISELESEKKNYVSPNCAKCNETFGCADRASSIGKIYALKDLLVYNEPILHFQSQELQNPNGNGDSERAKTRKSLNCRNDETPSQKENTSP